MKPKILLSLALLGVVVILGLYDVTVNESFGGFDPSANPPLKLTIVIPDIFLPGQTQPLHHTLINRRQDGLKTLEEHFQVQIENISSQPVLIWQGGNNEADGALSFEIDGLSPPRKIVMQPLFYIPQGSFLPDRLAPGEAQVRNIQYATGANRWDFPFPFEANGEKTVTLRAVFEEKPSDWTAKLHLWTGKVVSAPYTVVLKG